MLDLCKLIFGAVIDLLRSRATLEEEILVLRQQINVLRRTNAKRLSFNSVDKLILVGVCRLFPKVYDALAIVRPDTVIRWHRAGFRSYWRWKSRCCCGRPIVSLQIRRLIREMSIANPLWGAPRIHGELLKLGIDIGQTSVAKYMARRRGPPSQGWKTFLRNHAAGIVAIGLFVVPTISFRLLYGLLIMGHGRRQILWVGVTAHPTAEWLANQLTEACGWGIPRRVCLDDILAALRQLDDDNDPPPRGGLAMRLPRFSKLYCTAPEEPQRFIGRQAATRRHRSMQASRTPNQSRWTREANVRRYRKLLKTRLADIERNFIERRLAEELHGIRSSRLDAPNQIGIGDVYD
jgi:hypothetical protein